MNPDWARSIHNQCEAAGVSFFMKAFSAGTGIPDDLMVREWPQGMKEAHEWTDL
jgi:protein gp37